jgi:MSHA biogenesis protein MshQ
VIFYNGIPSPSNSKIYIDGIEQSISDRLKATTRSVSATAKVFISGWGKDTGYKFRGMLDEVRIYNRALSTGEIAALAQ